MEYKSFFKSEWTKNQIEEAVNAGYNEAIKNGVSDGQYLFLYDGEELTIALVNGEAQTAFGNYHYSYEELLNLIN